MTYKYVGPVGGRYQVCVECGAMVWDADTHETWHERIEKLERDNSIVFTNESIPPGTAYGFITGIHNDEDQTKTP